VGTGSNSGGEPDWYLSLLAGPAVVLQVRSETFAAVAAPASVGARERLWELMCGVFPKYASYGRDLPVVVVRRA
jgi:deazaflavin-dependent oxidoreductase (nitroreductase family)